MAMPGRPAVKGRPAVRPYNPQPRSSVTAPRIIGENRENYVFEAAMPKPAARIAVVSSLSARLFVSCPLYTWRDRSDAANLDDPPRDPALSRIEQPGDGM
jgi:hypothetical protein